jgi:hypothetical protein
VTLASKWNQNLVLLIFLENSKQQTNSYSMFIVLEVLHAKITFLGKGPLMDHGGAQAFGKCFAKTPPRK